MSGDNLHTTRTFGLIRGLSELVATWSTCPKYGQVPPGDRTGTPVGARWHNEPMAGAGDPNPVADQIEPHDDPEIEIRRSARRRRTITAYRESGRIVVLLPQRLSHAEEQRVVPQMVAKVLAKEHRSRAPGGDAELEQRAADLSGRYLAEAGAPKPRSVRWVSNQHSRWASCTPDNATIRLSERLRPMPAWVVDYVLLHELAHLLEREHNARFWSLVNALPDAERAKGYLTGWSDAVANRPD